MFIPFSKLPDLRGEHNDKKIVLVGGVYDLLHIGHIAYLEKCRELADVLVVAVSSDKRVRERKGMNRPVVKDEHRAIVLSALRCVDYSLVSPEPEVNEEIPTLKVLKALRPDVFATSDERFYTYKGELHTLGIHVEYVPDIRLTSTTDIINRIRNSTN